jgi:hypothetical protein
VDLVRCDHVRAVAERFCGHDCRWYHGNWELLKSLGLVSTSAVHAAELRELVVQALQGCEGRPRVLLSGSTDDTLLRILVSALPGIQAEISALDICATPLELMGEYAGERGLGLRRIRSDILSYTPDETFDLIVTHAFMGNFDVEGRSRLVRKWRSLLNRQGRVLTIQRVRAADAPPVVRFSPEQSAHFIQAARDAAAGVGDDPPDFLARVEGAARTFTERFRSCSITSRAELEDLFLQAGMRFYRLEYRTLAGARGLAGPSVPSGGEYAVVSAGRPV